MIPSPLAHHDQPVMIRLTEKQVSEISFQDDILNNSYEEDEHSSSMHALMKK